MPTTDITEADVRTELTRMGIQGTANSATGRFTTDPIDVRNEEFKSVVSYQDGDGGPRTSELDHVQLAHIAAKLKKQGYVIN